MNCGFAALCAVVNSFYTGNARLFVVEVVRARIRREHSRSARRRGVVEEVACLATVEVERRARPLSARRRLNVIATVLRAGQIVARSGDDDRSAGQPRPGDANKGGRLVRLAVVD